jgi:hypothetical protein
MIVGVLIGFTLYWYNYVRKQKSRDAETENVDGEAENGAGAVADARGGQNRRARRRGMAVGFARMRRQLAGARVARNEHEEGEREDVEEEMDPEEEHRARMEERRRQITAMEENRARKENARQAKYRERQAAREALEQQREKEEQERVLAQQQRDEEEFALWKDEFQVTNQGSEEDKLKELNARNEEILSEFLNYVTRHKVVIIDELAAVFGLRTIDVYNRLKSFEENGQIDGIFDDRGKFISITREEQNQMIEFIKRKGRFTIEEFQQECNRVIQLASDCDEVDDDQEPVGSEKVSEQANTPILSW